MPSETASYTIWWISLGIGAVVIVVVGILLMLIARTAEEIETVAGQIWTAGQRVAAGTVHIPLLSRTNAIAGEIVARAGGIDAATAQIQDHAAGCPGCPACVLGDPTP